LLITSCALYICFANVSADFLQPDFIRPENQMLGIVINLGNQFISATLYKLLVQPQNLMLSHLYRYEGDTQRLIMQIDDAQKGRRQPVQTWAYWFADTAKIYEGQIKHIEIN
jgi:hypothetical protein